MKRELASVTIVTAIAQISAFGKLWFTARLFGVGVELDGYNLGFVLPTLVAGILSGVLQTGLFPVYARLRVEQDAEGVVRFERLVFYVLMTIAATISLAVIVLTPWITGALASNATSAVRETTAFVLRLSALAIPFNAMGDYIGYLLALRGRYVIAAAAPIANALLGAGMLAAWPEGGLLNLTVGTVLGVGLQAGICLKAAMKLGFRPFGALPVRWESISELKQMLRLGGWILPGVAIANITTALPPLLLASHGEGAVSAFGYAYRLHLNAIQLLVMAGSPVILAHFSDMVARGDWSALRVVVWKAGWLSAVIGAAAVLLVWAMGAPLLHFVLGAGRFDAEASRRVAAHWGWLSLGLASAIWGNVLAKNLLAESRTMVMSGLSGVGLLALWASASILAPLMGEYATSAALTISSSIVTLMAWKAVRRSITRGQPTADRRTPKRELRSVPATSRTDEELGG